MSKFEYVSLVLLSLIGLANTVYVVNLSKSTQDTCQEDVLESLITTYAVISFILLFSGITLIICANRLTINNGEICNIKKITGSLSKYLLLGAISTVLLLLLSSTIMYEIEQLPRSCAINPIPTVSAISGSLIASLILGFLYKKSNSV